MTPFFDGKSDAELLAIFEPMMDNCIAGSSAIDHAQHVRDFTDRLAAIVTRENLEAQCASYQPQLGVFGRREFVCLFRRDASVAVVWRQFFTESDDEFVNQANFVFRDGRVMIDHCLICLDRACIMHAVGWPAADICHCVAGVHHDYRH